MATSLRKRRAKGTGGITQRADGSFQGTVSYRDEFDCLKKKYFSGQSRTQVQNAMRDFQARGCKLEAKPDGRTVAELVAYLIGTDEEPGMMERSGRLQPKTAHDYRNKLANHVTPRLGQARTSMVTPPMIDSLLMDIIEAGKRTTAKHCRYILGALFDEAVRLKWATSNPVENSMQVSIEREKRQIYTLAQLQQLAAAAESPRVRAWIYLAGIVGLRESEIAGLMWSSLSGQSLTIERQRHRSTTKTTSGKRVIWLPAFVLEALALIPRSSLWMFPAARRAGQAREIPAVHPSTVYHKIQEAMEKAKLPQVTVHDLRHSANNILKQLGVDSVTRRDILGHSSTMTTDNVYSQTIDTEVVNAMERFSEAWTKPEKEKQA